MPLDLTLTPLYRLNGREQASLPGLMAITPPRKVARGRERDRLIVYLQMMGNASVSSGEHIQLASRAASAFYETPATLTAALRAAAAAINKPLLERNMSTSGRGQYVVGLLTLAALRGNQLTLLLSGPMHVWIWSTGSARQVFDPLSGKGLGLSQTPPHYFFQAALQASDRLLFCSGMPRAWESTLRDAAPASLEATRRRLLTTTEEDLNAVLLQVSEGRGALTFLRPEAGRRPPLASPPEAGRASTPPGAEHTLEPAPRPAPAATPAQASPALMPAAHLVQPSAYAIPPRPSSEGLPPSAGEEGPPPAEREAAGESPVSPPGHSIAKTLIGAIQAWRRRVARVDAWVQNFLPRLLPAGEEAPPALSASLMTFMAVLIPLIVVTIASVVYFRYGRSVQYEEYLLQAQQARAQAVSLSEPAARREAWQRALFYLDKAEAYNETSETRALRREAQAELDALQGILRLSFRPALSRGLGIEIGRMAAGENDLYVLDAERGEVLHLALTGGGFELDSAFHCSPGAYGGYTVGPLVDILILPAANTLSATLLGIDGNGVLLYCAAGEIAQAVPLPPPDTNWGRVKAFTLDGGNLYVLDAPARAVWVYAGKDGAFVDRPYFFFGGQIPELEDAIGLAVRNEDLFILHADGHLSFCSYSRLESVPTRCVDPAPLHNHLPAYQETDLFAGAHFTQVMFSPLPETTLLLLDADNQGVFRFTPRSLEFQNQWRPPAARANPLPPGPVSTMTVSPNHVLYFAVGGRIYFATDLP